MNKKDRNKICKQRCVFSTALFRKIKNRMKIMKKFQDIELEIINFGNEDVICTSDIAAQGDYGSDEPWNEGVYGGS